MGRLPSDCKQEVALLPHFSHKLRAGILCALLVPGLALGMPRAEAVDIWGAAAQALGVFAAYKSSLSSILAMGGNVNAQVQSEKQDIHENGLDPNPNDTQIVNHVMERLTTKGAYVLPANSLPFIWRVNDSKEFNAACYPTDYVSINRALVRGLDCDPDELAAVLGHEMTHGLEQHSAKNYAKAVAQYYGMSFLNMDANLMDWYQLNSLANYSIAKNVTLPTEYDADEGGFYLMTSAGFNPGGGAAAMARMDYYLTYETQNVLEHQDINAANQNQENYNDHPDTALREQKLAQMMTAYGAGHVTVKDKRDIYIDGQYLLSADWTKENYNNTAENAYFIAGALSKAFHDYAGPAGWNFASASSYLTDDRVYQTLKTFVEKNNAYARLVQLVDAAYAGEAASGARVRLQEEEAKRKKALDEKRAAALAIPSDTVKKIRESADTYSDYGMPEQALYQMQRAMSAHNPDSTALNYSIRGRAKAVNGDYAGAIADSDKAVELDPKNVYNYLNRADVFHMAGDTNRAIADLTKAISIDPKNGWGPLMRAGIYDELGNHQKALADYKAFYAISPKAYARIPENYLKDISKTDYETVQKAKAEAKKKAAEAWKKEQKEKQEQAKKKTVLRTNKAFPTGEGGCPTGQPDEVLPIP